jgi:acyl carrier protein
MDCLAKYNAAFFEALGVTEDELLELEYQSTDKWDSVGHMQLMALLEDSFDIFFETDDIIDFSSYKKGKEILVKYHVVIE